MAKNGSLLRRCALALALALVPLAAGAQPAKPRPKAAPTPAPPLALEGTVKGLDGKPVEKAVVVARSSAARWNDPPATSQTDAQGRFRLVTGSRASHSLRVEAKGWAAQVLENVQPGSPVVVVLQKGGSIEGVIRDGSTGSPVAGARVEARLSNAWGLEVPWDPDLGRVVAKSDDRGRYRLDGLGAGVYDLTALSPEPGRGQKKGAHVGSKADLVLLSGASLLVTVLDPEGRPLPGALLRAEREGRLGGRTLAERTDAAGRFEFTGLDPGTYTVVAQHPDFAVEQSAAQQLDRESRLAAQVRLSTPVTLIGRLVGEGERPVAGAVNVQEKDGAPAAQALAELLKAEAGADGRFKIARVAPGSYALAVLPRGHAPDRVEAVVSPKRTLLDLGDIRVETGLTIRGRVREKGGAPVSEATLSAMPMRSVGGSMSSEYRAEADGSFVLAGMQPGAYRVAASAPGYADQSRETSAGSDNVDLVLEPAGLIAGTVVDEAGRPVESFTVSAQSARPERGSIIRGPGPREPVTAADGRFQLDRVAAGTWVLTVEAPDLAPVTVSDIKVTARATSDVGQVRLNRGGTLRGSVVDSDDKPIPAAQVTARGGGNERIFYGDRLVTSTDIEGTFDLKGVPSGTVQAEATHPQYAKGGVSGIDVDPAKGPAQTRIVLSRGGRIEGWARKRDRSAIPGAQVQLLPAERGGMMGMPPLAPVQADGSFLIEHAAPGRYRLMLMTGSAGRLSNSQTRDLEVHEGETVTVDFTSREILVTGRVTRGGSPLPNVKLDLAGQMVMVMMFSGQAPSVPARTGGPQRMTAVTREDGSYEMIASEPGSLRISVESLDGKTHYASRPVELPDAETYVLDLDLPSGQVAGVVLDKDTGAPIGEANVSARPQGGLAGAGTRSGPDGRFTLDLDPGDYRVTASAEGYASEGVDVAAGSSAPGELRIELARGQVLKGKVVDAQGRPAGEVTVTANFGVAGAPDRHGDVTMALADGSFRFERLRSLPYNLAAGSRIQGWGVLPGVQPGSKEVTLQLTPGGLVRLTVRGPEGAPLAGAYFSIVAVAGLPVSVSSFGVSDSSGFLEVSAPAGSVELLISKDRREGRVTVSVPAGGAAAAEVTLSEPRPKAR